MLVTYDSSAVYVAFQVWESAGITAQLTRRDADLLTDDAVILLLDAHRDRRVLGPTAQDVASAALPRRVVREARVFPMNH